MRQEHRRLIYRLDMTRCGVYWSRRRFTGWIVSCWNLVHSKGWARGRGQRGRLNSLPRESGGTEWSGHDFTCSHSFILSLCTHSALCSSPSVNDAQALSFSRTLSVYRSSCFLLGVPSSTTLTTSSSTAASVPTTSRSRRSWREVRTHT